MECNIPIYQLNARTSQIYDRFPLLIFQGFCILVYLLLLLLLFPILIYSISHSDASILFYTYVIYYMYIFLFCTTLRLCLPIFISPLNRPTYARSVHATFGLSQLLLFVICFAISLLFLQFTNHFSWTLLPLNMSIVP